MKKIKQVLLRLPNRWDMNTLRSHGELKGLKASRSLTWNESLYLSTKLCLLIRFISLAAMVP